MYSEFVKLTHEYVCKNKLAMRVLFEAEYLHISGEKNFKSESYFCNWLLGFYIIILWVSQIMQ